MTDVMIGVDPHKGSHTATMLDGAAGEWKRIKVRAGVGQVGELLAWAADAECRTWAVESAQAMGHLLAQQLVAAGEHVVDVPATLASRVRVLRLGPVPPRRTRTTPFGGDRCAARPGLADRVAGRSPRGVPAGGAPPQRSGPLAA